MVLPGADMAKVNRVYSHVQVLGQCRSTLRKLGLTPMVAADTAGSARQVAADGDPTAAAIASRLAAEIYGLEIVRSDIEDEAHNTTRFVVMSAEPEPAPRGE